jgi:hypothetical protein
VTGWAHPSGGIDELRARCATGTLVLVTAAIYNARRGPDNLHDSGIRRTVSDS